MGDHNDRHEWASNALIAAYGTITKVLQEMPLGIRIAPLKESTYADQVHDSLIRAYEILPDLPMQDEVSRLIREMILDWISGSEAMFQAEEDPEDWRFDFVELQAERIEATGLIVVEMLRIG